MVEKESRIKVGIISSAHGIKGDVKVKTFTNPPENIGIYEVFFEDSDEPVKLKIKRPSGENAFVVALPGIKDRNNAEKLIGKELYTEKSKLPKLPENQYYYNDIIGLEARLGDGDTIGKVEAMYNFGAGDLIEIRTCSDKKTRIFPFNKQNVLEVNISKGFVVINPPEEV